MKKTIYLSLLMIFALTGCGAGATKTMMCTYENTNANFSSKTTYNIDHEGDTVKKVRIMYDYNMNDINDRQMDGVGTGTDGSTNDTQLDNDGIIDGVIGSAIDAVINGVTDTILDISGIRDRHNNVQNTYGNIAGFSVQNTNDMTDNNYRVSYIIDYDKISDNDLATLGLARDINTLRDNYVSQGFTCK